jgi:hypothetical protein
MENRYKYDVFLSFSSKDLDFVKPIWEKLTKKGLKVFSSDEVLKKSIGLEFDDEIESALEQSNHFVLVCTPNAMSSGWVKDEYKAFYHHIYKKSQKQRRFIILAGPGFDISLVPLMMRQLQMAKAIDEIIETIADKTMPQKAGEKELISQKSSEHLITKKRRSPQGNKILNWFGLVMALTALMISVFAIIFQKTPGTTFHPILKVPKLYVSHLSFIDAYTHTTMANTLLAELINEAVIKGMNEAQRNNNMLVVNEVSHIIPNTDGNVNTLVNITFAPDLTKNQKINQIIVDLMNPNGVDVIVTGQYIDDGKSPLISVRLLAIVKGNQKIITKNLQFTKEELLCQDPTNPNRSVLCRSAYDQIAQAVQELLEQL